MSRALFVSDIHISSALDPKCGLFLQFLDACLIQKINELFLVGDIFDLWIADRGFFIDEYSAVVEKIRQLKHSGVKIRYFEGNHDLDLRCFWQHQLGVDVYSEAAFFSLNGLRVRVEHGDQMDPDDRGYLFLRWLLRTPPLKVLGRYLPNFAVRWIGRHASATSRDYTTQVKVASEAQVREKIRRHAEKAFGENPFDLLVSGHVHVVDDSSFELAGRKFRSVNMGTWLKDPMVVEVDGENVALISVQEFLKRPR